ncbi:MAG: polymer-forming cytoskeletal protein [Rhodothermales bacterium]|nr:polymer-forming cytoskeletal protein [Rhodothermales bacterium]
MSQTDSQRAPDDDVTVLSRHTEIRGGTFSVAHDLTVRGTLEGEVRVGGRVVVAAGASVAGTLNAREAIIAGSVDGELTVSNTLTLRSTAVLNGSARAARLVVEEGSSGDVRLRVGNEDFFDLLESRRREARIELENARSHAGMAVPEPAADEPAAGDGARENSQGWSNDVAVLATDERRSGGSSSDQMMESERMEEILPKPSNDPGHVSRAVERSDRTRN